MKRNISAVLVVVMLVSACVGFVGCGPSKDTTLEDSLENMRLASHFVSTTTLEIKVEPDLVKELHAIDFPDQVLKECFIGAFTQPIVIVIDKFTDPTVPSRNKGSIDVSVTFQYAPTNSETLEGMDDEEEESVAPTNPTGSVKHNINFTFRYDFTDKTDYKADLYIAVPSFLPDSNAFKAKETKYFSLNLAKIPKLAPVLNLIASLQENPNVSLFDATFPFDSIIEYLDYSKVKSERYAISLDNNQFQQSIGLLVDYVLSADDVFNILYLQNERVELNVDTQKEMLKQDLHQKSKELVSFGWEENNFKSIEYAFEVSKPAGGLNFLTGGGDKKRYVDKREMDIYFTVVPRNIASFLGLQAASIPFEMRTPQPTQTSNKNAPQQVVEQVSSTVETARFDPAKISNSTYKVKISTTTVYSEYSTAIEAPKKPPSKNVQTLDSQLEVVIKNAMSLVIRNSLSAFNKTFTLAKPNDPSSSTGSSSDPIDPSEPDPTLPDGLPPQNERIVVYLDGNALEFPKDSKPLLKGDSIMVPARFFFETLGGTMRYEVINDVGVVFGEKGSTEITLIVNNKIAYLNGNEFPLDQPATNLNDRVLVPLRFVAESLNLSVVYTNDNDWINVKLDQK